MNLKLTLISAAVFLTGCASGPQLQIIDTTKVSSSFNVQVYAAQRARTEQVPVRVYKPTKLLPTLPAVIFMGHCSGDVTSTHKTLISRLVDAGITVAEVASLETPGRPSNACTKLVLPGSLRSEEAFRARDHLVQLGLAQVDNVGVYGSSHGGFTITYLIYGEATNSYNTKTPFKAAVAVYPLCHTMDVGDMTVKTPTLILAGDKDTWTAPSRCLEMKRVSRGDVPLEVRIYKGATHSWDSNAPGRWVSTHLGTQAYLEYNPTVAVESLEASIDFLLKHLEL